MKYEINNAVIGWNDAAADKEATKQFLQKIQNNFEPTENEFNDMETEMNRERKFNQVSKLKNTLDNATKANQRKFKARYKQTNKKFLKEVQMIVQLAKLEMEEQKNASKRGPKKMV